MSLNFNFKCVWICQIESVDTMKFAKLNHMSIITLFAIAFIVVYLYYTISDVKKIHSEVKKMGQDIDKLNQSITNITTSILPMLTFPTTPTTTSVSQSQGVAQEPRQTLNLQQTNNYTQQYNDDDEDSVCSQELTKIMETIEDDEGNVNIDDKNVLDLKSQKDEIENDNENVAMFDIEASPLVVEEPSLSQQNVNISLLSVEDMKKVSYNEIRKYCKLNNIDDKGTKEVLIYRIKNPPKP